MNPSESEPDVVKRVLAENKLDAERALVVLIGTLVNRHLDCEMRRMGRRPPYTPGNERLNALTAAFDALYQAKAINTQAFDQQASGGKVNDDSIDNDAFVSGLVAGDLANVQQSLIQMLTMCQFLGERQAGLTDEDGEERPIMRLVKD